MLDLLKQLKLWGFDVSQSAKNAVVGGQITKVDYEALTGEEYTEA